MDQAKTSPRIDSLDLIRGVAVCGLAPINILDFASPDDWLFSPVGFDRTDLVLWNLVSVFGMGKFVSLFSILFGASMVLQVDKLKSNSLPIAKTYLPRLGWLWVFGMLHSYLIWYGDILVGYAVTGFVVFWCAKWPAKLQGILGWGIHCFCLLLLAASAILISVLGAYEWMDSPWTETEGGTIWDPNVLKRTWIYQMPYRATVAALMHFIAIPFFILPMCGSLMLIGMSLYKSGFFELKWKKRRYYIVILSSVVLGGGASAIGVYLKGRADWTETAIFKHYSWDILVTPLAAAGYASIMVLWSGTRVFNWLQSAFKAIGRMAFSNYIGQSIIFSLIFYGHGLGYYGKLPLHEVLMICPAVWIVQMIFSALWLHYLRSGPLEWGWRSLIARRRLPLRR